MIEFLDVLRPSTAKASYWRSPEPVKRVRLAAISFIRESRSSATFLIDLAASATWGYSLQCIVCVTHEGIKLCGQILDAI